MARLELVAAVRHRPLPVRLGVEPHPERVAVERQQAQVMKEQVPQR